MEQVIKVYTVQDLYNKYLEVYGESLLKQPIVLSGQDVQFAIEILEEIYNVNFKVYTDEEFYKDVTYPERFKMVELNSSITFKPDARLFSVGFGPLKFVEMRSIPSNTGVYNLPTLITQGLERIRGIFIGLNIEKLLDSRYETLLIPKDQISNESHITDNSKFIGWRKFIKDQLMSEIESKIDYQLDNLFIKDPTVDVPLYGTIFVRVHMDDVIFNDNTTRSFDKYYTCKNQSI